MRAPAAPWVLPGAPRVLPAALRVLPAALALAVAGLAATPALARQDALLAAPGAYSFAPVQPDPAAMPGGVASVGYGTRNTQTSSIQLQSGLLGNTGARAFLALGQARTDAVRGGHLSSQGGSIGIEKQFLDGTTITLGGGWQRDRLPYALAARPIDPVAPAP